MVWTTYKENYWVLPTERMEAEVNIFLLSTSIFFDILLLSFFFFPWMGETEMLINLFFLLQQQGSVVQWDSMDALHLLSSSPPSTAFEEIAGFEMKKCCWSSQRPRASHNYKWNEAFQCFAPWKETPFCARRRAAMGLLLKIPCTFCMQ